MEKEIEYPTLEEIVEINRRLGEGGILVNKSNLEFILEKAKNARGITRKAAIFLYDIISLHPFLDGNKRTAFHTMLYFLELNKIRFKYGRKEETKIEKLLNRIARKIEKREEVEKWIEGSIK
jgi:death-on-curing family protein